MILKNRYSSLWKLFILLFILQMSCSDSNDNPDIINACTEEVLPRNSREIAFDILDATEDGDFSDNFNLASTELKTGFIQLLQAWNAFANAAPNFDGPAIENMRILNDFASSTNSKLSIIITPIDIPGRFVPTYLGDRKFDDPVLIEAFIDLINHLFEGDNRILDPSNVIAFSVGNEINHYNWAANNDQITEYVSFLKAIKPHLNRYEIPLHFTGTLAGMTDQVAQWKNAVESIDKLSITYYPINSDFTVKDPDVIWADFDKLMSHYSGIPIFIQEIGYPSAEKLNSSEIKQSSFFCNFFSVWDKYPKIIDKVSILRLNDVSEASARQTAQFYGIPNNENFIAYIQTLGIRTWEENGTNKLAFETIKTALQKREW